MSRTWAALKQRLASRTFDLYSTIALVLLVLVFQGTSGDGQNNVFSYLLHSYVEETSASVVQNVSSPNQLAELNSLTTVSALAATGGQSVDQSPQDLNTIHEDSVAAWNPANDNYADEIGITRSQIDEYTVQPGDTLSFIASDYGVSQQSIIWANNLKGIALSPGQILKIPPVSGVIHLVKKGDTIQTIATKYGVDTAKIIEFNSLPKDGQLAIDDELVIPDGTVTPAPIVAKTTTKAIASVKGVVQTVTSSVGSAFKRFASLPDLGDFFMIPTNGFNWGRVHDRNGVDIANACGTPIYAAADGVVNLAKADGYNGGYGRYIRITHDNGTETLYAHATQLLVTVGQSVVKGQEIALMGTTGHSTGCHLHFEVHGAHNPLARY